MYSDNIPFQLYLNAPELCYKVSRDTDTNTGGLLLLYLLLSINPEPVLIQHSHHLLIHTTPPTFPHQAEPRVPILRSLEEMKLHESPLWVSGSQTMGRLRPPCISDIYIIRFIAVAKSRLRSSKENHFVFGSNCIKGSQHQDNWQPLPLRIVLCTPTVCPRLSDTYFTSPRCWPMYRNHHRAQLRSQC